MARRNKGGRDGVEPGGDTLNHHSPSPRKREIQIGPVGPGRFLTAAGELSPESSRLAYRPVKLAEPVSVATDEPPAGDATGAGNFQFSMGLRRKCRF